MQIILPVCGSVPPKSSPFGLLFCFCGFSCLLGFRPSQGLSQCQQGLTFPTEHCLKSLDLCTGKDSRCLQYPLEILKQLQACPKEIWEFFIAAFIFLLALLGLFRGWLCFMVMTAARKSHQRKYFLPGALWGMALGILKEPDELKTAQPLA